MKILIVDDDRINSTILNKLLTRDGHTVVTAFNGREGVERFQEEQPDLVLMDVRMPLMNGYEAARQIKEGVGDRFIPIIFLTAVTDDEGLARCIEAGGDDFLTKPFNRLILQSKIGAMERIRQLHSVLHMQKHELEKHQENIQQELAVGEHLFSNIVRAGNLLDSPCLQYTSAPMSQFNGDLLVASYSPAGSLHILLGDFTGHGLSAAVGAMPLAELFYDMTAQGFSISEIVEAMNAKLAAVMPRHMFCAACLIELDMRQKSLLVWNGGLPGVAIVDGRGEMVRQVPSTHLPLGVAPISREDRKVEIIEMQEDYRVYLFSDGLTEAVNLEGEMFGCDRLGRYFDGSVPPDQLFETIMRDLDAFRAGAGQQDDISLLEINCAKAMEEPPGGASRGTIKHIMPSQWQVTFHMSAGTLKAVDPLPTIVHSLMSLQAPTGHRERIYTILAELFSNALDHGLLQLDTKTKSDPEGFLRYYSQREERLNNLEEGHIHLSLRHIPQTHGGVLSIRVEDSGPGFDIQHIHSSLEGNIGHGGRGIALIRSMCQSLVYNPQGNVAEVEYVWSND